MQASTAPAKFREDATFIHEDCMHTVYYIQMGFYVVAY